MLTSADSSWDCKHVLTAPDNHQENNENQSNIVGCPLAENCGGCGLSHLRYPDQLALKQENLDRLLASFGSVSPIIGMDNPWRYRCKVEAVFGPVSGSFDRKGSAIVCGKYRPHSHDIVPVTDCPVENAAADAVIADIRRMMPKFGVTAYDERRHRGFLRHVLIRASRSTGDLLVVLVGAEASFRQQKAFCDELMRRHSDVVGIVLNRNDRATSMVLGTDQVVLRGRGFVEDSLCGCRFRISPGSFYQVNPEQAEVLYETALNFAGLQGRETLLDAYCGTGTIGIAASRHAGRVVGVELNPEAVRDAIHNARLNRADNCRFICADAGRYLAGAAAAGQRVDVVIMDPPRSGSDIRFLSTLVHERPKRIVYVSCGPESLARDLRFLVDGGYEVTAIQPVDMFPHTEHMETVACLQR